MTVGTTPHPFGGGRLLPISGDRGGTTWAAFLRSQAHAIVACEFFTATTLTGARRIALAAIEHSSRRVRVLGATTHPTGAGSPRSPGTS